MTDLEVVAADLLRHLIRWAAAPDADGEGLEKLLEGSRHWLALYDARRP